jgi:alpha/beta superfamily hydrolase
MARLLETTFLAGPAGRLEALHEAPDAGQRVTRAAVICHPHPLYGGTMHNKVVFRLARSARRAGAAVLRFNFRGVGQSAGAHDEGKGEQDDFRAALTYMSERYPGLPLMAGGFSFGSRVALRVACGDARLERCLAAGAPVNSGDWSFLNHCGCPKFFLHSTNDIHGARAKMEAVLAAAAEPKKIAWIEAADHFFVNALDEFEEQAFLAWSARPGE